MASISTFVKSLRDIMRNDSGVNGDAQRIEQIAWMLFLKVYSEKEKEWKFGIISRIDEDSLIIEDMEKERLVADYNAQFLALGYEENLASETAQAMVNGEIAKVIANQKAFLETHDKAYKAKLMGGTSTPPAGNGGTGEADYLKLIEDAQNRGDYATAAYCIRLSEEEKQNNK